MYFIPLCYSIVMSGGLNFQKAKRNKDRKKAEALNRREKSNYWGKDSDIRFSEGLWFYAPNEQFGGFGSIRIKREEFMNWLEKEETTEDGFVVIDLPTSKKGDPYTRVRKIKHD